MWSVYSVVKKGFGPPLIIRIFAGHVIRYVRTEKSIVSGINPEPSRHFLLAGYLMGYLSGYLMGCFHSDFGGDSGRASGP